MNYAILDSEGAVINVISATLEYMQANYPDGNYEAIPEEPPAPAVPQQVTMRQARRSLLNAGLLNNVNAAIAALPSPSKEEAEIEWEYSQVVKRHRSFVSLLAPVLNLTEQDLDSLFIAASQLQ